LETLANLEGNPETAMLLQQAITASYYSTAGTSVGNERLERRQERTLGTEEEAVPTQADLFRGIGERLRIGIGKSGKQEGTPLDAIIYYAQRTADLDNFTSACDGTTPVISLVVSSVVTFCS